MSGFMARRWSLIVMSLVMLSLAFGCGDNGPKKGRKASKPVEDPLLDDDLDGLDEPDLVPGKSGKAAGAGKENSGALQDPGEAGGQVPTGEQRIETSEGEDEGFKPTFEALEHISKDVFFVSLIPDLTKARKDVDWERFENNFTKELALVGQVITGYIGYNILNPGVLGQLGISETLPIGMALLSRQDELPVIFATIEDRAKLETFLEKAGELTRKEDLSGLELVPLKDGKSWFLITRGSLFLVIGREGDEGRARAVALAEQKSELSIQAGDERRIQWDGFMTGGTLVGYFDLKTLNREGLDSLQAEAEKRFDSWADRALEQFNQVPPSDESIESLKAALMDSLHSRDSMLKMALARKRAVETFVGPMDGCFWGVVLGEGPLKARLLITHNKNMPSHILQKMTNLPPIISDTVSLPVSLILGGQIDVSTGRDILMQAIEARYHDVNAFKQSFKADTGLDLEGDLLMQLTGEVQLGFGFSEEGPLKNPGDLLNRLNLSVIFALRQPELLAARLKEQLVTPGNLNLFSDEPGGSGQLILRLPGGFRDLYVGIARGFLTVSTDPEFFSRMDKGMGGTFIETVNNKDTKAVLLSKNLTTFGIIKVHDFFNVVRVLSNADLLVDPEPAPRATRKDETPEYRNLAEQIVSKHLMLNQLYKKKITRERIRADKLEKLLGDVVIHLRPYAGGIDVVGFIDSDKTAAEQLFELALHFRVQSQETRTLESELIKMEEELKEMRTRLEAMDEDLNLKLRKDQERETREFHDAMEAKRIKESNEAREASLKAAKEAREAELKKLGKENPDK